MDRQKALKAAEKLLAQGKTERAVQELTGIVRASTDDPLTINRVGDTLVRHGMHAEAVEVYTRLGTQYADAGFLPKAIAIFKKIHRLQPEVIGWSRKIGELYLRQKLPGEARGYLRASIDRSLEDKDFDGAQQILSQLVEAEPDVLAHRARLAETLALSGDTAAAASQLVALGKVALALLSDSLRDLKQLTDWRQYGGAPILGFDHLCIKAHGRSSGRAISNAVRVARKAAGSRIGERIRELVAARDEP